RRVGRNDVGEDRHQGHDDNDDEAGDRAMIGDEIAPELAQRPRRLADEGGGLDRCGRRDQWAAHDLRIRGLITPEATPTSRWQLITIIPSVRIPPCSTG